MGGGIASVGPTPKKVLAVHPVFNSVYHLIQYIQAEGGARAKERVLYFIWHFLPVG